MLLGSAMLLISITLRGYLEVSIAMLTRARVSREIFGEIEGDDIRIVYRIENRSMIPILFLELHIDHSKYIKRKSIGRALAVVLPRDTLIFEAVFEGRIGRHRIGPLKAVLRDPLGLYRSSEIVLDKAFYLEIYPRIHRTTLRRIYSYARNIGYIRARQSGEGVEMRSVREYRPGDDIRRIVWKKYARFGRLIVKELERESSLKVIYILLCSPEMFKGIYRATPYEHTARVIGTLSRYLAYRSDHQAIILALPYMVYSSGGFRKGFKSYIDIAKIISSVDFEEVLNEEADSGYKTSLDIITRRIELQISKIAGRERSLILLFTDPLTAERAELTRLLDTLRAGGHKLLILMPIRSLYDIKALKSEATLIYRIKIASELEREKNIMKIMRSKGLNPIAITPDQMIYHIIEKIELYRY
ncbi:MAG: DUF58 domain-containing protein [Sulfolobales archaeon]